MKKILFLIGDSSVEPLGVGYLSSALKQEGHIVRCVMVKENLLQILAYIKQFNPDYLVTSFLTGQHKKLLLYITAIKNTTPFLKVIAGGPHVTYFPEIQKNECIDYIIRGEADYSLPKLIDNLEKNIIPTQKDCSDLTLPLDLDLLPFPDRFLLYGFSQYRKNPVKNILTSRGCPYNCTYCVAGDTKILLHNNEQELIKNLKVGDELLAVNTSLEKTKVSSKFEREVSEYYVLELEDGTTLKVTGEHPIMTKRGWVEAKELTENDEVLKV